ncbi:MAG: cobyrinate a,c-diamide synthase [Planctomycetota bacterium]|nr:cobyrinate a,c-diamide synthase [Planctomycetota bacterium]
MPVTDSQPRLMITAPSSGTGKTALVIGLLQALSDRGMNPAAFKSGPDYIDPMYHREVLGVASRNLDLFFTSPGTARGLFSAAAAAADISVLEGAMGHYDGVGGTTKASAWHLAAATSTPAVLVARPKGAFLTLAAMINGILRFREDSMIKGVVLNRCSESYAGKLSPILERETGLRVFGSLPDLPEAVIESRHLGLATPDTVTALRGKIVRLAREMKWRIDIDGLVALARSAPRLEAGLPDVDPVEDAPVKIAVAVDKAFCFYYQENLDLLRALGAELIEFSPLADERLPDGIGGLYLGGGYPELHAGELAANEAMRESVRTAVGNGLPTLAECGGFLYLLSRLADVNRAEHAMAGVIDGCAGNAGRLKRFGYTYLRAKRDTLLCPAGAELRAHEFHYWNCARPGDAFLARKASGDAEWECVFANDTLFAGFPHLYFWSDPDMARRFVAAAARRTA